MNSKKVSVVYSLIFIVVGSIVILCNKSPDITQTANPPENVVDWKAYLSKSYLLIDITNNNISAHSYILAGDTVTTIDSLTLNFSTQDSNLVKDSSWYSCKDRINMSCFGEPVYIREKKDSDYPHAIVIRYRVNKNKFITDTALIDPVNTFKKSVTFDKKTVDSTTFTYDVSWSKSAISSDYAPYMTIAIDNGIVGAEYFESHPNYDNMPETPQFPEGYRWMYGRYKTEDGTFVFQSRQDKMPFVIMVYTIKRYSQFDIRVMTHISAK